MNSGVLLFGSAIAVFLSVAGAAYLIGLFNSLIQIKNNIEKAWNNIDVLLQQRNEEIPKLIAVCKEYMDWEKEVFTTLLILRSNFERAKGASQKIGMEQKLQGALNKLMLSGEAYPQLQSNDLFQQIATRFSDLEKDVANRRNFFNNSVALYNTRIEKFPHLIFAALLKYRRHPYLNRVETK